MAKKSQSTSWLPILATLLFLLALPLSVFVLQQNQDVRQRAAGENRAPVGDINYAGCDVVIGWACDKDSPDSELEVHLYRDGSFFTGGTIVGGATANQSRDDNAAITSVCGGSGGKTHGFTFAIPNELKDGKPHSLYVHGISLDSSGKKDDLNPALPVSKSITCTLQSPVTPPPPTPTPTKIPAAAVATATPFPTATPPPAGGSTEANCTPTELGCISNDPIQFAGSIYGIGLGLIGGIALLFIMFGGYLIMTSRGDSARVKSGKSYILYAILGLLLAIFGYVLLTVTAVDILQIPGFSK